MTPDQMLQLLLLMADFRSVISTQQQALSELQAENQELKRRLEENSDSEPKEGPD